MGLEKLDSDIAKDTRRKILIFRTSKIFMNYGFAMALYPGTMQDEIRKPINGLDKIGYLGPEELGATGERMAEIYQKEEGDLVDFVGVISIPQKGCIDFVIKGRAPPDVVREDIAAINRIASIKWYERTPSECLLSEYARKYSLGWQVIYEILNEKENLEKNKTDMAVH